jgi:hypothetical protein
MPVKPRPEYEVESKNAKALTLFEAVARPDRGMAFDSTDEARRLGHDGRGLAILLDILSVKIRPNYI